MSKSMSLGQVVWMCTCAGPWFGKKGGTIAVYVPGVTSDIGPDANVAPVGPVMTYVACAPAQALSRSSIGVCQYSTGNPPCEPRLGVRVTPGGGGVGHESAKSTCCTVPAVTFLCFLLCLLCV